MSSFQPGSGEWPSTRLHAILLATFAGLLILLLGAGLMALESLRKLQAAERELERSLAARAQSMSTLVLSVHSYNDRIQRYLLEDRISGEELARLSREIESRLREYPAGRSADEQQMLQQIDRQLREQEQIVESTLGWSADDRRRHSISYLRDLVIPHGEEMVQTCERIVVWSQQELGENGNRQLQYFDETRRKLTEFLVLALAAGIVLAAGSLGYVLRLGRQARTSYRELAQSRAELQQLSARMVDAQEAERRSISRELHDEVGQSLGALLVDAGRLGAMLPPGLPGAQERLERIKNVAENTLQTVRDIALLLRPSMLDDLGLVAALEWQGREVERRSDAQVHVQADGVSEDLSDDYKTTIYRLVQEALHNASRHAGAKNIRVTVLQTPEKITVEVADDGRGFDAERVRGMGILGMHERAKHLGGTLHIESRPGAGTTLRFELPRRAA